MIYSFHMPLFMLISGYLFYFSANRYPFHQLIEKKIKGMLQPILMGTILYYYATIGLFNVLLGQPGALLNGEWIWHLDNLWFLWSLLGCTIVVGVMHHAKGYLRKTAVILCGFPFVALFPNMQLNIYMLPFFLIGYCYASNDGSRSKAWRYAMWVFAIGFLPLLTMYEKRHFIYTTGIYSVSYSIVENIAIHAYRYLIGVAGSAFVISAVSRCSNRVLSSRKMSRVARIGEKSLMWYVLSVPFLSGYLPKVIAAFSGRFPALAALLGNTLLLNCVITPILLIVYVLGLGLMVHYLERSRISSILFGR